MKLQSKLAAICVSAAAIFSLTACTAPQDPFVETVNATVEQTVFNATGQMASGCVGVNLFCLQPMYEPLYFAPAKTDVNLVCKDFLAIASKLGVTAYSVPDFNPYKFTLPNKEVEELCVAALGTALKGADGTDFYQGLSLYDDGAKDSFGKVYSLERRESEFGDGFMLTISFSKDLTRTGVFGYGSEKPKLITQADLDSRNEANKIAIETMKVANPLLGQDEQIAKSKIEEAGLTWVVIDRDNQMQSYDQAYNPSRIMLTIREGKVYDAIAG